MPSSIRPAQFYTGIVTVVYGALRGTYFPADRYRAFVATHGTPALELGCGDDGPFFELAEAGLDIVGVDSSLDMVTRGRERLAASGLTSAIHHQPMEELALDQSFASIYLAGPTFNLLPDDPTALKALHAIAGHLLPSGAALVPLWTPPPTAVDEIGVVHSAPVGQAQARFRVLGEDYDVSTRTRTTRVRYELETASGTDIEDREWIIHWHDRDGFARLAAQAGLAVTFTEIDDQQVEAELRRTN